MEQSGAPWFILSDEHGLVHPDTELAPYEKDIKGMPAADAPRVGRAGSGTNGNGAAAGRQGGHPGRPELPATSHRLSDEAFQQSQYPYGEDSASASSSSGWGGPLRGITTMAGAEYSAVCRVLIGAVYPSLWQPAGRLGPGRRRVSSLSGHSISRSFSSRRHQRTAPAVMSPAMRLSMRMAAMTAWAGRPVNCVR